MRSWIFIIRNPIRTSPTVFIARVDGCSEGWQNTVTGCAHGGKRVGESPRHCPISRPDSGASAQPAITEYSSGEKERNKPEQITGKGDKILPDRSAEAIGQHGVERRP